MRVRRAFLAFVGVCASAVGLASAGEAARPPKPSPFGTWITLCTVRHGAVTCDLRESYVDEIGEEATRSRFYYDSAETLLYPAYRFDPSKRPMWLDMGVPDADSPKGGICRFDGELLMICGSGIKRPQDFSSDRRNDHVIVIYRPTASFGDVAGERFRAQHPESLESEVPLPGIDAPPYRPVYPYWRMLCRVEGEGAVCPEGKRIKVIDNMPEFPDTLRPAIDSKVDNAVAYGRLIYSQNPAWLDEIRMVEKGKLEIRRGLCKREGNCLLWIVNRDWEDHEQHRRNAPQRPASFRPTKENGWILRVLYPPTEVFKEAAEKHKAAEKAKREKEKRFDPEAAKKMAAGK